MNLFACFARGLIPGPGETEEQFWLRVQNSPSLGHTAWEEAACITLPPFGFAVDWVPVHYSSHHLAWWEAGATWISKDHLPSVYLRPSFKKGVFLGYKQSDVLAHEALHAARMRFDEPKFEEMLAYALSPYRWKRFLGPVFRSRWVVPVLLLSLLMGLFSPWVPILVLTLGVANLLRLHGQFRRCLSQFPLSVVVCMTDKEIARASKKTQLIAQWERDNSPRCKLLFALSSRRDVK